MSFNTISPDILRIDAAAEVERIAAAIRSIVFEQLKRRGAVVGLSGGIDSSVVAFLCVRALGKEHVLGLLMPDQESPPHRLRLGHLVAGTLGVRSVVEEISSILQATHSYGRRDEAVRRVIPEYRPGYKCRILLPSAHGLCAQPLFTVVVQSPDGRTRWVSLTEEDYLNIVAASTFKERARKMMEYYYADRLRYAVAGTANRLEHDQGFFVKNGDGAADLKPIAHLYQSQVCQLAEYLGVPQEIRQRPPSNETYSLERSCEELYFMVSPDKMDLCLYGKNKGVPAADLVAATGLDIEQVQRIYEAIEDKRKAAHYLRAAPVLVGEVSEV